MLLAATAAIALTAAPAHAQLAVICPTCASEFAQVASWGKQAADMVTTIQQLRSQYQMLTSTYQAIAHATDLAGTAAALGGVTRTYLPEASDVVGLMAGSGNLWGTAQRALSMGRYLDVGEDDPWAREMQRRERVTANARSIGIAGYQDTTTRFGALGTLLARIEAAVDGTEVQAVSGLVAVEQQNVTAHQGQIDQVRLMLETEDRVDRQRAEQMRRESANVLLENTSPVTDSLR